eukprot:4698067-Alexandrium_andersonii.AAC.1
MAQGPCRRSRSSPLARGGRLSLRLPAVDALRIAIMGLQPAGTGRTTGSTASATPQTRGTTS